ARRPSVNHGPGRVGARAFGSPPGPPCLRSAGAPLLVTRRRPRRNRTRVWRSQTEHDEAAFVVQVAPPPLIAVKPGPVAVAADDLQLQLRRLHHPASRPSRRIGPTPGYRSRVTGRGTHGAGSDSDLGPRQLPAPPTATRSTS